MQGSRKVLLRNEDEPMKVEPEQKPSEESVQTDKGANDPPLAVTKSQ